MTEDGLDGFCHYCPCVVEVFLELLLVEDELAQTLECALDSDYAVAERYAYVAQNGRVGEVALQTAHGELLCEELQNGVSHAEVALRVLEVDGVHLVRHCRRAYFACLDLLLEVFHRYVHPEVAVEVDDDCVDAAHCVEHRTEAVVVGDLCSELLALQSELLAHEAVAERLPVVLGVGYVVSVVVAGSTAELSGEAALLQLAQLLLKTIYEHHHLLAQTCGRSGLSVCLCEHRHCCPLLCILAELCDELLAERVVELLERLLDREGH